jgi:hypothetical protein
VTREELTKMSHDAELGTESFKERSRAMLHSKLMKKNAENIDDNCKAFWKSSSEVYIRCLKPEKLPIFSNMMVLEDFKLSSAEKKCFCATFCPTKLAMILKFHYFYSPSNISSHGLAQG